MRRLAWTATLAILVGATIVSQVGAAGPPRLQIAFGEPNKVSAGLHRSPAGFRPDTTFWVGAGWFGGGDAFSWGIGKGIDRAAQTFKVGGIQVDRLEMPYAKALAVFRKIGGLKVGKATHVQVGGYPATSFRAKLVGGSVVLEKLGADADINEASWQQTFVNVRGMTLLVRIEVMKPPAGAAEVGAVLRSFTFPR